MQDDDVIRQLSELADLRSSGMLSNDEFMAAKQRVLHEGEFLVDNGNGAQSAGTGGMSPVGAPPPSRRDFPPVDREPRSDNDSSPDASGPQRSSARLLVVVGGAVMLLLVSLIFTIGMSSGNDSGGSATALSPSAPGAGTPTTNNVTRAGRGQAVPLPIGSWTSVGDSTIDEGSAAGSFRIRFDDLYWGGVSANPDIGCDYTVTGYGRIVQGNGYGIAVRAGLNSGTPEAQAFQYDSGIGGYRITQYPSDAGSVIRAATDTSWHRVSMSVSGTRYEVRVDEQVVAAGFTTSRCGGVYLRVWEGGIAEFRDMTVSSM